MACHNSVKIRVSKEFKIKLKREAAEMDMSMIRLSQKLSKTDWGVYEDKKKKKQFFEI